MGIESHHISSFWLICLPPCRWKIAYVQTHVSEQFILAPGAVNYYGVGMPSWPRKKSFRIYWETIWLEGELENSQEWGDESAKKLHIQEVLEYCAEVTGKRYGTDQTG